MRRVVAALVAFVAAGCAPFSAAVPVPFLASAEVLEARRVAITAGGGAGVLLLDGFGAGGAVRVRVGVGGRQEVGLAAAGVYVRPGAIIGQRGAPPPSTLMGAALEWKLAPLGWLAVEAGVGGTRSDVGLGVSGHAGLVVSPAEPIGNRFVPYGAIRGALSVPFDGGLHDKGGVTESLATAIGAGVVLTAMLRVYVETGFLRAWDQRDTPDRMRTRVNDVHGGLYGALGLCLLLGGGAAAAPAGAP